MRRRLLLSYMTLTLLVLLLLEVPLGLAYAKEQRLRLTATVERDALALSIRAEESFESEGVASVREVARTYQADTGGRVVVIRPDGSVIVDSAPRTENENFKSRPEFRAALQRREVKGSRYSKTLGHDILYFAVPIVNGEKTLGALRVTYPTSFVDARINRGWWVLVGIGLVVLLIVFLVSLRLARQVTIPIERLARASALVGSGALDTRAEVPRGPPEIRELAEQFNATAARLERLMISQQEFVADASHQLRTPLAALRFRLENLASDVRDAPEVASDVEGSLTEVARLSRLVDGLMALARAERSAIPAEALPLGPIVSGRIEAWSAFADEHQVTLTARQESGLVVRAAPGRIEQALDNLIANAIEVSPVGGAIEVETRRHDGMQLVTVSDDGPGLTDEQRARAFDRFWRASGRPGGAGLGLAIVRQLVEADGGTVRLEAAPGGGLCVALELRAAERERRSKPA